MTSERDRALLYLHIPKTGGTTFFKVIYRNMADESIVSSENDDFYHGVYWFPGSGFFKPKDLKVDQSVQRVLSHGDLRAVIGHFWYGIHQHVRRPWIYCTMLRNPVDRVVSLYNHVQPSTTLEEFVLHSPFREVDNDQTRRISGIEPEIGGCTDAMLRKAQENLKRDFALVSITERFDETVILMKRRFGWTKTLPEPRYNVSRNPKTKDVLNESVRRVILERNHLDQQLYDYAGGLLDEAISREKTDFLEEVQELRALNEKLPPSSYVD
jgi:hypothetical protein